MKTNKILNIIFIVLFICSCAVPSLGMLIWGQSEAGSNEIQSSAPRLIGQDGSFNYSVLEDASDWFADRFALRQQLITAWAEMNVSIFHTSTEDQVILGNNGWLYFNDTLKDYTGVSLTESELNILADNLYLLQEYAVDHGISFVFTVAPNKNSLYAENMPGYIINGHDCSNLATLPSVLNAHGVVYANMADALTLADDVLYYETDTHWNAHGAALGADTILAALGKKSSFRTDSFQSAGVHTGDLWEMLYPTKEGTEAEITDTRTFSFVANGDTNGGNAITIHTENPDVQGTLMCWRDSFGIALYPYLAESFGNALFSRSNTYDLMSAINNGCDTIVIELVERNLDYLLTFMPVFEAPKRNIAKATATGEPVTLQETSGTTALTAGMKLVTADLTKSNATSTKVYLGGEGYTVQAYLLKTDNGLQACAWIPEDMTISTITVETNGILTAYPVGQIK